ncbi:MAG: sirohydrochlorin chelatase [Rhizonema sp. PD37]|nr:sirohydrochlorin chelatase [Rhizonema sp. PD37]
MPFAYLLVSHGSRDPRPITAMQQLAELVCQKLQSNLTVSNVVASRLRCETLVGTAYLELSPEPLHEQIVTFGKNATHFGCNYLKILPLFLLPGVHVMQDIPSEVALAKQFLSQDMMINLQPYLGSHPKLGSLLSQRSTTKAEARILLAHGSRRPLSHNPVEAMAVSLGAIAAYWAMSPSLESRVQELVTAGCKQIAVLPYFLFTGGIVDAIAHKLEELKLQFPEVSFQLAEPLGVNTELADLIWELMES